MAKGEKPIMPEGKSKGNRQSEANELEDLEGRRHRLGAELERRGAFKKPESEAEHHEPPQGMAQAIKLSSEFLAGVVVGIALGLGFDQLVGTSPWGLIIFLFLGFAAGVLNVLRSVGQVAPSQIGKQGALRQTENDGPKVKCEDPEVKCEDDDQKVK